MFRCCAALTAEEMFTKQMHQETDAEKEVLDLKRMQVSETNFFDQYENIFINENRFFSSY